MGQAMEFVALAVQGAVITGLAVALGYGFQAAAERYRARNGPIPVCDPIFALLRESVEAMWQWLRTGRMQPGKHQSPDRSARHR